MIVIKERDAHTEFSLDKLCVPIAVVITFTVSLSDKLCCCQIQHNFKCIKYLCKLCKEYLRPTGVQNLKSLTLVVAEILHGV